MTDPDMPQGPPRLVTGAPGAIEAAFLHEVAAIRATDPLAPVDVLVGGVLLRPYLQRLIAETSPGMINVRFQTLGEFGVRLGEAALALSGRRPLPAMAERALVHEAARGCDGYFAAVAATPGFADDLAALYERYAGLRAGTFDGIDALAQADAGRFDGAALLLYGIGRLGAAARRLVGAIAGRVPVVVFLPSVDDDADAAHGELRAWLAERGAVTEHLAPPAGATALTRMQEALFAPEGPIAMDGSLALVSVPDPPAEVREVARTCLAWARDGIPFRQMAVAYRQAEVYRHWHTQWPISWARVNRRRSGGSSRLRITVHSDGIGAPGTGRSATSSTHRPSRSTAMSSTGTGMASGAPKVSW
jgi:hypothetical protein